MAKKKIKKIKQKTPISIAFYLFLLGVLISLVISIFGIYNLNAVVMGTHWSQSIWINFTMFILGVLIGLILIRKAKVTNYIIAVIGYVLFSIILTENAVIGISSIDVLVPYLGRFLVLVIRSLVVLITATGLVLAIKEIIRFLYK